MNEDDDDDDDDDEMMMMMMRDEEEEEEEEDEMRRGKRKRKRKIGRKYHVISVQGMIMDLFGNFKPFSFKVILNPIESSEDIKCIDPYYNRKRREKEVSM